jgi:hypothetical protein
MSTSSQLSMGKRRAGKDVLASLTMNGSHTSIHLWLIPSSGWGRGYCTSSTGLGHRHEKRHRGKMTQANEVHEE